MIIHPVLLVVIFTLTAGFLTPVTPQPNKSGVTSTDTQPPVIRTPTFPEALVAWGMKTCE